MVRAEHAAELLIEYGFRLVAVEDTFKRSKYVKNKANHKNKEERKIIRNGREMQGKERKSLKTRITQEKNKKAKEKGDEPKEKIMRKGRKSGKKEARK